MARLHSIHLPHFSESAEQQTKKLPVPEFVTINLAQHIGAPLEPLVKVGDKVLVGQKIGDTEAFMAAPVHASISGEVTEIKNIMNIMGRLCKSVTIKSDNRMEQFPDLKPPEINSREDFLKAVRESGSLGLGGAGFPTHVKLGYDRKKYTIDHLLVNGAECEPYITSDYRELMENAEAVIGGIQLVLKWLEIPQAVIGIEADKPKAIEKLTQLTANIPEITVQKLKSSYPQGAEKVLVHSVTGRIVGEGMLPADVGCVVLNVSTAGLIYDYCKTGMPMVKRRITVDGNIVNSPANLFVPVGTLLQTIVNQASLQKQPDKIVLGGPMMGGCAFDPDTPLGKTNNAVLLFSGAMEYTPSPCIRCGSCVRACPLNLMPTEFEHAYDTKDEETLRRLKINLCMNCGACSFVCPARRNLAEKNQLAKDFLRQREAARKAMAAERERK